MAIDPKLLKAMQEDEAANQRAYETLVAFSHRRLKIRIKDPAAPDRVVEVGARIITEPELVEYKRRLGVINPGLIKVQKPGELNLTPEEDEKLFALYHEYISKATGYTIQQVKELGNARIITTLLVGILRQSNPSEKELEEIVKFRADE